MGDLPLVFQNRDRCRDSKALGSSMDYVPRFSVRSSRMQHVAQEASREELIRFGSGSKRKAQPTNICRFQLSDRMCCIFSNIRQHGAEERQSETAVEKTLETLPQLRRFKSTTHIDLQSSVANIWPFRGPNATLPPMERFDV